MTSKSPSSPLTPHSPPNRTIPPLPRLGVLGASRIVKSALVDVSDGLVSIDAVAARDLGRATDFAADLNIPRAHGSYRELVEDPELDAVYIALPCAFHAEWCIEALRHGKHVLCEKPFALHLDEARAALQVAREEGLLLMEAHHWRYHPLVAIAEDLTSTLGPLQKITAEFTAGLNTDEDIRLNPALGPGVLMDFGCYAVQWCEWLAAFAQGGTGQCEEALKLQVSRAELICEDLGVDLAAEVELQLGPTQAHLSCDMRGNLPFRAYIQANFEHSTLHFENPLSIEGSYLEIRSGGRVRKINADGASTYKRQLEAFVQAMRSGGNPPTSGASILQTQATLDAIYKKAGVISRRDLRARSIE